MENANQNEKQEYKAIQEQKELMKKAEVGVFGKTVAGLIVALIARRFIPLPEFFDWNTILIIICTGIIVDQIKKKK